MNYLLDGISDEEFEELFDDEFSYLIDKNVQCRARNREARRRHLRNSMKTKPIRYQ